MPETTIIISIIPDTCHALPVYLSQIGSHLQQVFSQTGNPEQIDGAVFLHAHAVALASASFPTNRLLGALAMALQTRFSAFNRMADMERSISSHQRAVVLAAEDYFTLPGHLFNLGTMLFRRFELLGRIENLDKAIACHERALTLIADGQPLQVIHLCKVGVALLEKYKVIGEADIIERAIENCRRALAQSPENQWRVETLCVLGNAHLERFRRIKETKDIDLAVSTYESAVQLTPDRDAALPSRLGDYGNALLSRSHHLAKREDIDSAIAVHQASVSVTPDSRQDKSTFLTNLGNALSNRFEQLGETSDLDSAILAYKQSALATGVGPPYCRFEAAVHWSNYARICGDASDESVLEAYSTALNLLPHVSWLGRGVHFRLEPHLIPAGILARDGAAAALATTKPDPVKALEWLEQGRSIMSGHMLHRRARIDEFCAAEPELATDLRRVADDLQAVGLRDFNHVNKTGIGLDKNNLLGSDHALANDWERLIRQMPQPPGCPKRKEFVELRHAAIYGPVVVINVSRYRCDALVLVSPTDALQHVQLSQLTYERAQQMGKNLRALLARAAPEIRGEARSGRLLGSTKGEIDRDFRSLLAELWLSVIRPVMECLEEHPSPYPHDHLHIHWCTTGPLAFLPIHAAGLYNEDGTRSISLPDIAISSYVPTLNALLNKVPPSTQSIKLLAIIQPNAPGASPLPATIQELDIIQNHSSQLSIETLQGPEASVSKVLSRLPESQWVHFACHGIQYPGHPLQSGLVLEDGRLELQHIIRRKLPYAEFAFLSACTTATGLLYLPEESVHLAAGMLQAGFRSVVGTMWSIEDRDAPDVVKWFYESILVSTAEDEGSRRAEVGRVAFALHDAIGKLRDGCGGRSFAAWVPFIRTGV